jgi:hypothetical protein
MKPQHQKFAELIAIGKTAGEAYQIAYEKPRLTPAVHSAAQRLAAMPTIIAKVKELRTRAEAQSEAAAVMTLVEKRKFLAEILRTPVTKLDPKQHDHLIKKITRRVIGSGEEAEEVMDIEGYDKLKAIELDTELAGDGNQNEFTRSFLDLLRQVPATGMIQPTDKM